MKVLNYRKLGDNIELAIEATDEEIGYLISIALDVLIVANKVTEEEINKGNLTISLEDIDEERFYKA